MKQKRLPMMLLSCIFLLQACQQVRDQHKTDTMISPLPPETQTSAALATWGASYRSNMYSNQTQRAIQLATSVVIAKATTQAASSSTPTPSATLSALPSPTPTNTPLPFLPFTPLFATPDSYYPGKSPSTPIPVPTPLYAWMAYRLKGWTQKDSLELIQAMDQYTYASDVVGPSASRGRFQSAQIPIRYAIWEALSRFPSFLESREISWRLAVADAIQNNAASNPWILNTIEHDLNRRYYSIHTLGSALALFGFELVEVVPAPNLFSDARQAYVIHISIAHSGKNGIFFALKCDWDGFYRIFPMYNSWSFDVGDFSVLVGDHNANNIPEVVLSIRRQSGGFCAHSLLIYEWHHGRFSELTNGGMLSYDCDWSWEFSDTDENGARYIDSESSGPPDYSLLHERYKWNGRYFELHKSEMSPSYAWSLYALHRGEYPLAGDLMEQTLADQTAGFADEIGPSFPDFLQFQSGMIAALQGNVEKAKAAFTSLAENPFDPDYPAISKAARRFLESYNHKSDIYKACEAARSSLNTVVASYTGEDYQAPDFYSKERIVWGIEPWKIYSFEHICTLSHPFRMLVEEHLSNDEGDIVRRLREMGVQIHYSILVDLSGDHDQDYILLVNTPDSNHPSDRTRLWVILNTGTGYRAYEAESMWYPDPPGMIRSSVIRFPGFSQQGLILQVDDSLFIYRIDDAQDPIFAYQILEDINVDSYDLINTQTKLEIALRQNPSSTYTAVRTVYRWDHEMGAFVSSDWIEEQLFVHANPSLAISPINEVLRFLMEDEGEDAYDFDRYLYLLGLAYDLSGDSLKAVETYWRLWHEHPGSPYAIMAREKLELQAR